MNGRWLRLGLCAAVALLVAACGDSGSGTQTGTAFVFLTVDSFSLGGTRVASVNSPLDDEDDPTVVCVTLRSNLKNPTVTAPTPLDNVTIDSYTVTFPLDGLGPFVFNTAVLVPAGVVSGTPAQPSGNVATFPVILLPGAAKRLPPLRPFPPLPNITSAEVTFRGQDGRGQKVTVEGALTVILIRSGEETTPTCTTPT